MDSYARIPWTGYRPMPETEIPERAHGFADELARRRTVRDF